MPTAITDTQSHRSQSRLIVHLPASLLHAVDQRAKANCVSRSDLVRIALLAYVGNPLPQRRAPRQEGSAQ